MLKRFFMIFLISFAGSFWLILIAFALFGWTGAKIAYLLAVLVNIIAACGLLYNGFKK